ncbi:meiosis-specific with OB domain-containing protein-like isoform X2 [Liolophura sinensis]|uniref:meiosis-specific with OB domain-containing protein-like isoform X2 n=1 Tax=Liolophura sinensis TaxID=3198878 RepID=UPI00315898D7
MSWHGNFDDFDQFQSTSTTAQHGKQHFHPSATCYGNATNDYMAVQDLVPGTANVIVIGLVISKEEPREVICKSVSNGSRRFALSFVIRDSVTSYIAGTCWGSENYIKELTKNFHIYDVVEVYNPQIQTKLEGTDKFRPWTPSPYHLNMSEHHSIVKLYQDWDSSNYTSLQHVPIRPDNDYYPLSDIVVNGQAISGEHVNILAAVKSVGQAKDIVTKKGRQTKRCEVNLFDKTCSSFTLILWNEEVVNQAILWNPGEYVISAVDVRVYYDDFRCSMVATADSKTIFIVNPDTKEAHTLYMFAQSQPVGNELRDQIESFGLKDPEIFQVKDVLSVSTAKLIDKEVSSGCPYYCILYAYISQFDIDQECGGSLRYRCPKCKQSLEDSQQVCLNPPCIESSTSGQFLAHVQYDIAVTLSDHSGSLPNCRLNNNAAEEMIGLQVFQYFNIAKCVCPTVQKYPGHVHSKHLSCLLHGFKMVHSPAVRGEVCSNQQMVVDFLRARFPPTIMLAAVM